MLDKNGAEIQVGDVVKFNNSTSITGTVSEVGNRYYICNDWSDDLDNGVKYLVSGSVEVISKSNQPNQDKVFLLIRVRVVPCEFIERCIIGVFKSNKSLQDYYNKNPLPESTRHEKFEYEIEEHEVI